MSCGASEGPLVMRAYADILEMGRRFLPALRLVRTSASGSRIRHFLATFKLICECIW